MSDDVDWHFKDEIARDLEADFDVRREKQILAETPRPIEQLDLVKYREYLTDELERVGFKHNAEWDKVDPAVPVIFGREGGKRFPIDGRHRLKKALNAGLLTVPSVSLTDEETAAVRLR